jgi:hypothetical protein
LRHDELSRRIVTGHIIGVNVVRAFVVVDRLQLEARVVVGKNVGETILGTIAWQISERTRLVAANVLQFLELFAKPTDKDKKKVEKLLT